VKSNKPARQQNAGQYLAPNERIIPPHAPGMRIGLFGGTFDPPHRAHLDACLLAMKRLKLDRVWWLVTPGNPLKNTQGLAPLGERIAAARALTHHPRIDVTGLEAVINTRYSYDTIEWLLARCPRVQFVWIMGADNLRHFHRWQKWRGIAQAIPMVVVDRPGPSLYASNSTAGQALAQFRIPENAAASLPGRRAPAWTFLHGLKSGLSSTALRALRRKPAEPKAQKPETVKTKTAKTKTVKKKKPAAAKKAAQKTVKKSKKTTKKTRPKTRKTSKSRKSSKKRKK
jgi:nicotinate-nucleotide adenylyltransferase